MKLNKGSIIKIAGIAGTMMSIGATILTNYSNKKEQDEAIDRKVNEALKSHLNSLVNNE